MSRPPVREWRIVKNSVREEYLVESRRLWFRRWWGPWHTDQWIMFSYVRAQEQIMLLKTAHAYDYSTWQPVVGSER